MKLKTILVITFATLVAGCYNQADQAYSLDALKLPEGCEAKYAGVVKIADLGVQAPVIVVKCEKEDTVTTNINFQHGKVRSNLIIAQVD